MVKNGVEIILKNDKKISCSIFRKGLREYIFFKERKQSYICNRNIEIKHTKIQQSQFVFHNNHFHRSSLFSLRQPFESLQTHSGSYKELIS